MNSRGRSVPTEPSISTGHNPDTLRDIRRQIETNNKKHEAVSNFNKRLLFSTIFLLIILVIGFLSCIIYLFSLLSGYNNHATHSTRGEKGVYPYFSLYLLYCQAQAQPKPSSPGLVLLSIAPGRPASQNSNSC